MKEPSRAFFTGESMIDLLVILAAVLVIALIAAGKMKNAPRQDAEARETSAKREIVLEATVGRSADYEANHKWAMEQAHHQIMAEVDAPANAKERLLRLRMKAEGSSKAELQAFEVALGRGGWGDEYFGRWRERFKAGGAFPYMWKRYPPLCAGAMRSPPTTIEDVAQYLLIPEMRELAIMLGIMPEKNRPRTRKAFAELLVSSGKTDEIVAAAMPGYEKKMAKLSDDIDQGKWKILEHTLRSRFSALRNCRQNLAIQREGFAFMLFIPGDCPLEAEYAAKLEAGELNTLPPLFPGDRTSIIECLDEYLDEAHKQGRRLFSSAEISRLMQGG